MSVPSFKPLGFFTPTQITGCKAWFDAYDASYTTSGTTVTTWTNKSGNANASTGGGTVSINQATLNGKSSVRFAAGTNFLNVGAISYSTSYRNQFFVVTLGASGNYYWYLNCNDTICGQCYSWNDSSIEINRSGTVGLLTYPTGYFGSTSFVSICTSSGGNTGIWINGVSQRLLYNNVGTGGFWSGGGSSSITLGGENGRSTGTLDMYELLQYDGNLTTAQRQQIEGYLAQKWGLTGSLPPFHPGLKSKIYPSLPQNRILNLPISSVFLPTSITGCQLWLDGNDPAGTGVKPANGATVSTWNDRSGNGYNATPSSGRIAGTFSSPLNCVYFQSPSVGYQTSYPANPTNESMFIVANIDSPSSINNNTLICGQQGARSLGIGWNGTGATNASAYLNSQVTWQLSTPAGSYAAGTTALITGQVSSGTNLSIAMNGATFTTGSGGGFYANTTTHLGVDTTSTAYYYKGYAMEIIFYNSVLNTSQRQTVEGYLAWKWGLQSNLPGDHPYKAAAPTSSSTAPMRPVINLPRFQYSSTGLVFTHQDGRSWKVSGTSIYLNTGTPMSISIYAGSDVYNSANGRVALFNNGSSANSVRHASYVMYTNSFAGNNYDFAWYFVSSGSGYLIYNDFPNTPITHVSDI